MCTDYPAEVKVLEKKQTNKKNMLLPLMSSETWCSQQVLKSHSLPNTDSFQKPTIACMNAVYKLEPLCVYLFSIF